MRSVVGPLLFGLFPLIAGGCVLPERSLGRAEDLGFRPRGASSPRVTSESQSGDSISFKIPKKNRGLDQEDVEIRNADRQTERDSNKLASTTSDSDPSSFLPGHSSDAVKSLDNAAWPSAPGNGAANSPQDTKSTAVKKGTDSPIGHESTSTTDRRRFSVNQAINQSDGDLGDGDPIPPMNSYKKRTERETQVSHTRHPDSKEANGSGSSNTDERSQFANSSDATSSLPLWTERPTDENSSQPDSLPGITTNPPASLNTTSQTETPVDRSKPILTGTLPALPWQTELEQLIARVEQDLGQSKPESDDAQQNEFLRKQAHLRLLYLMAQRQEDAMTAIPSVDTFEQEFWQQMVWAMSNSFDTLQFPEASERAAQTVPPLSAALRQMREQADLSIKNMTFCRKISYFGNYERFPRNDFTAGHEVLLYTEIENFVSAPTVDGEYRTSLKSQIEIADSQGKIVWTKGFPSTEDFCRNPRRDYFHNYQFYIPEDLSTGAYTLKLTIVDELSKKRASNSLNFVLK